jgi:hypothetical protein
MKILPHTLEASFRALKVLSFTLLMILAVVSCNDDDDDNMVSFLDKHGDTQWKFQDPNSDTVLYLKINDSQANPFELWLTFLANSCYVYQSVEDDGTPEILENTENKLVIRVDESNDEYTIVTLTASQNVLTVTNEDYENGELDEENIVILFANQDDIDNIEICAF